MAASGPGHASRDRRAVPVNSRPLEGHQERPPQPDQERPPRPDHARASQCDRGRTPATDRQRRLVDPWGRAKAYRPLPARRRRAALEAGLRAYARGDFFAAHEILEPAWMGARDTLERSLYQGLIKLAAGLVHGVRGNPQGVRINLLGARERLVIAAGRAEEISSTRGGHRPAAARGAAAALARVDVAAALAWIDAALARLERDDADPAALDALLEEAARVPLRAVERPEATVRRPLAGQPRPARR